MIRIIWFNTLPVHPHKSLHPLIIMFKPLRAHSVSQFYVYRATTGVQRYYQAAAKRPEEL